MEILATKFRRVVVDECSQATETAALCALGRGAESVVLIGDHKQLPATVLSTEAARGGLARSLFERFVDLGVADPVVLVEQRRMHPSISHFPNQKFYGGQLVDAAEPANTAPIPGYPWAEDCQVSFVDTSMDGEYGSAFEAKRGFSAFNQAEVTVIEATLRALIASAAIAPHEVGVLTPYAAQKTALQNALRPLGVCVDTVDGWQGMERDFIVFSATRSNALGDIGFLSDPRRMNVMLTRARRGLVVVGDRGTLQKASRGSHWGDWLQWVDGQNAAISPAELRAALASLEVVQRPAETAALPGPAHSWVAVPSDQGTYYWNTATNETTWDKPEGDVPLWDA
jgi:superfamily I DNA and/or RNA helicase